VNTYAVTFYDESDADPEDVEVREIEIRSDVDPDDLAAGEWDAHSLVVTQARVQGNFTGEWEPSHVRLPDGENAMVPAGL
jgi:hypothetical protein